MGRIKTTLIKRTTNELLEKHREELTDDFEKNKAAVEKLLTVESKKMRNVIAGYATKLVKAEKKAE